MAWALGWFTLSLVLALAGAENLQPFHPVPAIYSAICWLLLYLWLVGLAWRTRSIPVWFSLLFFIYSGVSALQAFLIQKSLILYHGDFAGGLSFVSLAIALLAFLLRSRDPSVRFRTLLLASLFLLEGLIIILNDVFKIDFVLDTSASNSKTPYMAGNTGIVAWLSVIFFASLALLLAGYPFRSLSTESFR